MTTAKKSGGGGYRSAISGRYVTAKRGKASPRTTVHEAPGKSGSSGPHYRSAISGRYVTTKHGKASPRTTYREFESQIESARRIMKKRRNALRELAK